MAQIPSLAGVQGLIEDLTRVLTPVLSALAKKGKKRSMGENVRVRFETEHDAFRVTSTPFAVPSNLSRDGLSEVVKHLLGAADGSQSFDFMIGDVSLRTKLSKFISHHKVDTERVLVVVYFPTVRLSSEIEKQDAPAWVGCIDTSCEGAVFGGCYDGSIQVTGKNLGIIQSFSAHTQPVRAVKSLPRQLPDRPGFIVVTGSKDHTVKLHSSQGTPGSVAHVSAICNGHLNSVESLAVSSTSCGSRVLLSGDWSGMLFGWDLSKVLEADMNESSIVNAPSSSNSSGDNRSSRKRQRVPVGSASSAPLELKPTFSIKAHSQAITGIYASTGDNASKISAFTCSYDHSIKMWDLHRQDCSLTFAGPTAANSLDMSPATGLLASAHPDGRIRLWDSRAGGKAGSRSGSRSTLVLGSPAAANAAPHWVSQAVWQSGGTGSYLGSSDYQGAVSLWDTRVGNNAPPVETRVAHQGKALCCAWLPEGSALVSGGSDCALREHRLDAGK
jgi:ribosome biogenesis protein YTM1